MAELTRLDSKTSAVLTLDCQKGIVELVPGCERIFKAAGGVLEAVRAARIRVIHVGLGFRPGYPEFHPGHSMLARIRQGNRFVSGSESAESYDRVAPVDGEITVAKHRVSAFSGSDLEMILRSQGITEIVLFGISTSGVVLSTLRQASDLDFRCIVIKDCCFDADEEVHRVLTEKVFPRQADVVDADTFLTSSRR